MEKIIFVLSLVAITVLFYFYLKTVPEKKITPTDRQPEDTDTGNDSMYKNEKEMRREIYESTYHTLEDLGCQPEGKSKKEIVVRFQGETFLFYFSGNLALVIDPNWEVIRKEDPLFSVFQEAILEINEEFGPTIFLSSPTEDGNIYISSRYDIRILPQTDNRFYLQDVLCRFFEKKKDLGRYISQRTN